MSVQAVSWVINEMHQLDPKAWRLLTVYADSYNDNDGFAYRSQETFDRQSNLSSAVRRQITAELVEAGIVDKVGISFDSSDRPEIVADPFTRSARGRVFLAYRLNLSMKAEDLPEMRGARNISAGFKIERLEALNFTCMSCGEQGSRPDGEERNAAASVGPDGQPWRYRKGRPGRVTVDDVVVECASCSVANRTGDDAPNLFDADRANSGAVENSDAATSSDLERLTSQAFNDGNEQLTGSIVQDGVERLSDDLERLTCQPFNDDPYVLQPTDQQVPSSRGEEGGRARNPVWDAFVAICGNGKEASSALRKQIVAAQKVAKDLSLELDSDALIDRGRYLAEQNPGWDIAPANLLWSDLIAAFWTGAFGKQPDDPAVIGDLRKITKAVKDLTNAGHTVTAAEVTRRCDNARLDDWTAARLDAQNLAANWRKYERPQGRANSATLQAGSTGAAPRITDSSAEHDARAAGDQFRRERAARLANSER